MTERSTTQQKYGQTITKFKPKLLLFNGNPWYVLLKEYRKLDVFMWVDNLQ